ncbi:hypothetical protein P879_08451 [Paragonimus westermani]|uniref:Uncharacterized protein n=1 Tax=Paragonimus westermani TaxID=34504 RepID=A0A8T0DDX3_9TREM|nr:hypothetical protein P879_08451 [Paragonimus westermani]
MGSPCKSAASFFPRGERPSTRATPLDILLDTLEQPQDVSATTSNPDGERPNFSTPRRETDHSRRQVVHM